MNKHCWKIIVYLILLIIGIPWYWPAEIDLIVFGLPVWVFVAIIVSIITSLFTAFLLLISPWNTTVESDE